MRSQSPTGVNGLAITAGHVYYKGGALALVVPFTSQKKTNEQFYHRVTLEHFDSYLCLSQMRVVSQKRIFKRIKKMPQTEYSNVRKVIFGFYNRT